MIFVTKLSGDDGEEVTPVPMPNTEVKLFSADGSWGIPPARVGRPTLAGGIPQLPSALKSLTSVFGMGTGVTSSPSSPDNLVTKIIMS